MRTGSRSSRKAPSPQDLVRALRKETQKHELLVKRAHICEHFLMFVLSALRDLRGDEGFVTLLRAEKLDEMPKHLYEALVKS